MEIVATPARRRRSVFREVHIRRRISDDVAEMDTGARQRSRGFAHHGVSLDQLTAARVSYEDHGLETGKNRAVGQPREKGIDDLIRTDSRWRERGRAGFPRGSPPTQYIPRKMVLADVFFIQELRRDEDSVAGGWAGLLRGVLERAVVAVHVASDAVKDDYRAADAWLGLGPIERDVNRLAGRAMRGGYTEGVGGDGSRMAFGGRGDEVKAADGAGEDQVFKQGASLLSG